MPNENIDINKNKEVIIQEFNEKFAEDIEKFQIIYKGIETRYNEDLALLNKLNADQTKIQKELADIQTAISLLNGEIASQYVGEDKKDEHRKKIKRIKK